MADTSDRFPPLYLAACALLGVGIIGLAGVFWLRPPAHIFKGLLYISLGCLAFGTGEILNHPKSVLPETIQELKSDSPQIHRKRNVCSLGNLCDIGALLLLFIGLSTLIYSH